MKKEVITHRLPKSPISEIFRTLRTNIQFMNTKRGLKTIMVTSTTPADGKSWVTANLAVTFAQAGKKVILVDCDLRKGRQFSIFGISPTPGLSNFLSGIDSNGNDANENILTYIKPTEVDNLYVIPAGNIPPNPSELLVSEQMMECIEKLKSVCDLVIFDSTPSCLVTDAVIMSRYVDSTIIVASHKSTKIEDLERIKKDIQNVGGKIAGVVLNKMPITQKKYESAYYYGSQNGTRTRMPASTKKAEQELKAEFDRKNMKEKTKQIINQNRNDNNNDEKTMYTMPDNNEFNSEDLLKQLNDYINEEKAKIKGENND